MTLQAFKADLEAELKQRKQLDSMFTKEEYFYDVGYNACLEAIIERLEEIHDFS